MRIVSAVTACIRVGDLHSLVGSETRSLSGSKGMATFRKRKRLKGGGIAAPAGNFRRRV